MTSKSFSIVITKSAKAYNGILSRSTERPIVLQGEWGVAVTAFQFKVEASGYICCDLVDYSYINSNKRRYLDWFNFESETNSKSVQITKYVTLSRKRFNTINISIFKTSADTELAEKSDKDVIIELHFRKQ